MKNFFNIFLTINILLVISSDVLAQQGRNEEIIKSVTDHFSLERENIHAHFDKNVFTTDESIWFKGYIFHRKKNIPFFSTVNVFANLMDADGKILKTKLIYGNIGNFTGSFKLDGTVKPGKYYVQFYTNWMNNFIEDESAVYEISVIDTEAGLSSAFKKPDPAKIIIDINPEGGTLLNGIANTVGLHIADCNNNPLPVSFAELTDAKGTVTQKIPLNTFGYGKFEYPTSTPKGYKIVVILGNLKHEKALPTVVSKGVSLEVNSYAITGKTVFKLRTNTNSYDAFKDKPLYLLIHQDEKALVLNIDLNASLEQTIVVPNSDFADGMNTVRILDSNLTQLAERIFFKQAENALSSELQKIPSSGSKQAYKGNVSHPNMILSIALLPEQTNCFDAINDIYASFMILPYVEKREKISGRYYFTSPSRSKMYEFDILLLNQKSKYSWNNILHNPPISNYTFDMGLTVKGTIPGTVDTKSSKIRLFSLTAGLDVTTEINDKREFTFTNIIYTDSTYVNFTLLKEGKKPLELTLSPLVINNIKKFNKPYKPKYYKYAPETEEIADKKNITPKGTELKEIIIQGSTLKYAKMHGNKGLYAYKISEMKPYTYQTVLDFIGTYGGFSVSYDPGTGIRIKVGRIQEVQVKEKNGRNNIFKTDKPWTIVYLNNRELVDLEILSMIEISEVDEIYMFDSYKRGPDYLGIIKIYLNKGVNPYDKSKTPNIVLRNGFGKVLPFENIIEDDDFESLGVAGWEPGIMTNEKGEFTFSLPKPYNKKMKVLIEGFSADGKLISEIKNL